MPRLATENLETHGVSGSAFSFKATRIGDLGATEYTLVTIAVDVTGSVGGFEAELRDMLITAVDACRRSPRSHNLLLRTLLFSSTVGVQELHGFMPLTGLDPAAYPALVPSGVTPLYDATFSAVGAMTDYGAQLAGNDFLANGIVFVITDGGDNASTATPGMIRDRIATARADELLESLVTVLIGINAGQYRRYLEQFQRDAGLDQYVDAGEATAGRLAKLAAFVSQSVSSQSQALGTGGPSQAISATI